MSHQKATISLPLAPRDFLILLALAAGQRHGYGLVKDIEELSDGTVRMDPANLYRSLKRLVQAGLVLDLGRRQVELEERRRYYGLSDQGRQLAAAEAARVDRLAAVARARRLLPGTESAS